MNEIDDGTRNYLTNVIRLFSPGIRYACAYGSGVFKQSGHASMKDNMIDFIFVVNNAFTWHQQNLNKYPNHYSFLKHFSPNHISKIQKYYGAAVYFNTRIDFNGRLIKYGVIEQEDFIIDLLNWETLYISGRLHKPIVSLKGLDNPIIYDAIQTNLRAAFETSLLTLPDKFTDEELFLSIAGLSYAGDFRMIIGEDKNKIKNIVEPNIEKFRILYKDIIHQNDSIYVRNNIIEQDKDPKITMAYLQRLPQNLYRKIQKNEGIRNQKIVNNRLDEVMTGIAKDHVKCKTVLIGGVHSIVKWSSIAQSLKGVFTAGFSKSIAYSGAKVVKMVRGLIK